MHTMALDQEDPDTHDYRPGAWREEVNQLTALSEASRGRSQNPAQRQRELLVAYVNGPGAVAWQREKI